MEWKTTCQRIWLNHPTGGFCSSLLLFFILSMASSSSLRQLGSCISGGVQTGAIVEVSSSVGAVPSFVLLPLLWLAVLLLRALLFVLPLELHFLRPLFFYQVCRIFHPFCEYPISSPPSLSGWTEQTSFWEGTHPIMTMRLSTGMTTAQISKGARARNAICYIIILGYKPKSFTPITG